MKHEYEEDRWEDLEGEEEEYVVNGVLIILSDRGYIRRIISNILGLQIPSHKF